VERDLERSGDGEFGALCMPRLAEIDMQRRSERSRRRVGRQGIVARPPKDFLFFFFFFASATAIGRSASCSSTHTTQGKRGRERRWSVADPGHAHIDDGQSCRRSDRSQQFREDTPEFAGWPVVDFKTDRHSRKGGGGGEKKSRTDTSRSFGVYQKASERRRGLPRRGVFC